MVRRLVFACRTHVDVPQGQYEYQYKADSTQQPTATSNYQDYQSSEIPRYAPTPDAAYGEPAYGTSPLTPGYTTSIIDDTTASLGNMTLEKGKDREAGIFPFNIRTFNM
jgi:hypothetical protein